MMSITWWYKNAPDKFTDIEQIDTFCRKLTQNHFFSFSCAFSYLVYHLAESLLPRVFDYRKYCQYFDQHMRRLSLPSRDGHFDLKNSIWLVGRCCGDGWFDWLNYA